MRGGFRISLAWIVVLLVFTSGPAGGQTPPKPGAQAGTGEYTPDPTKPPPGIRFTALDSPQFVDAAAAVMEPGERVIGLWDGAVAKAYPVRMLAFHHVVNDTLGSRPVIVVYCALSSAGAAYDVSAPPAPPPDNPPATPLDGAAPSPESQDPKSPPKPAAAPERKPPAAGPEAKPAPPPAPASRGPFEPGGLENGTALLRDRPTRSIWSLLDGAALRGPAAGVRLGSIRFLHTTWASWLERHPSTKVLSPETPFKAYYKPVTEGAGGFPSGVASTVTAKDDRLKPHDLVVGVRVGDGVRTYPASALASSKVLLDTLGGRPVVVFYEPKSGTAAAFVRPSDNGAGRSFEADPKRPCCFRDAGGAGAEGPGLWSLEGNCLEGPRKGESLEPLPAVRCEWYAWAAFHPGVSVFGQAAPAEKDIEEEGGAGRGPDQGAPPAKQPADGGPADESLTPWDEGKEPPKAPGSGGSLRP